MPQGVKYCVGVFEKDSIISYYERFQDGIFLKDEKGIKDSLWTYEIFDGVEHALSYLRDTERYKKIVEEFVKE